MVKQLKNLKFSGFIINHIILVNYIIFDTISNFKKAKILFFYMKCFKSTRPFSLIKTKRRTMADQIE